MLRDFRAELHENAPSDDEISRLLHHGDLAKALKANRSATMRLVSDDAVWQRCAYRMMQTHRCGELLSFMHKHGMKTQFDTVSLIMHMFEGEDYSGFLKQVERFDAFESLASEVERAITALEEKGLRAQAAAYRRALKG